MSALIQNSPEWLKMRKNKIGSSDASVILGTNPWRTPYQLWCEKNDLIPVQQDNEAMKRGRELEPIAREAAKIELGINLEPIVKFHEERNWQMASLDGWNEFSKIAIEIKCGGEKLHSQAKAKIIPEYYQIQMQHQMAVCGINSMYYFSYFEGNGKLIEIERDDRFIYETLIPKEFDFWNKVQNLEEPELCDKDFIYREDHEWNQACYDYLDSKKCLKVYEEKEKRARKRLIELSNGSNCKGSGISLTKSLRKGAIEYKSHPKFAEIDWEPCRKPPIEVWRIGEI